MNEEWLKLKSGHKFPDFLLSTNIGYCCHTGTIHKFASLDNVSPTLPRTCLQSITKRLGKEETELKIHTCL